ncbi:MAG: valyl-tRNA synthetase [Gaiellaceae bacterium]|jgi:valyl-tRNA synthetase|nr:valyl-tRNA synthetase [Gaiellaceae bacterium]
MDSLYKAEGVEERWQQTWEAEGHYNADPDPSRESFVIAHPPPNVTGDLHMGHALQLSLADTMVRMRRMQGYNTLFQPGFDHAGISTQNAVEKHLALEGKTRQDLGREAFEARVWEWLREYGGKIMLQFRRIGASLDYRRERFTMDEAYTRAVMRFFVHLYEKGWIYRANRIINWCPFHQTALSDLEVAHKDVDDALTYVRYPLADGDGSITIATVRPATILGDVAVAVHPDDERYRELVGREVVVPVVGRRVPVIADERVERDFGTGALKVTPGHDPLDYELGRDHDLPELTVIGLDGRMNEEAGELAGLTQEEADVRVLNWLKEHDQLEKRESYRHTVALCDRCQSRIEPRISLQWWCSMTELRKPALEALRARRVRYHPESQHRFAIQSLEDAPDWNISRQIWWGHQLPVWECPDGHVTVAETEPAACTECGSGELTRSTDVLDTWFSSALWPFATLGWPEDTEDLRYFYPGDLNTTARDIIRLWENRMIFSGLELMGEVPFHDVVIHSTVHAPTGGRMSKSLGTGMNPLASIETYGADATRYGLMKMASSQDVRFSEGAIEEGRKLANKLWNVSRLILQASEGAAPEERARTLEERWILARLSQTQLSIERLLGEFDYSHMVGELYHLTFDDFCDWYAEAVKGRLYDGDVDARATAVAALERLLKLLHPAMPHVTEEIWSNLPARKSRLIVAPWPAAGDHTEAGALAAVQEAAVVYRRSGVLPKLEGEEKRIFDAVVKPKTTDVSVAVRIGGEEDPRDREIARLQGEIKRAEGMLANKRFLENAPADVVADEREKLARYQRDLNAIRD